MRIVREALWRNQDLNWCWTIGLILSSVWLGVGDEERGNSHGLVVEEGINQLGGTLIPDKE